MSKRVLAIEDESAIRDFYAAVLEPHGYVVEGAAGGLSGLKVAEASPPDLILLDVGLPDLSGWEVLRYIRSTPQLRNIPVVIASVQDDPNSLACGWAMGCTWYLPKPMHPDELSMLVNRLLRELPASPVASIA